jgi:N4-gp56 family major capsid protein
MAKTEYGLNHPLAVKLWSKTLFEEALKETYFKKFISTGTDNIVQYKNETAKSAGDRITFGLRMQLSGAGVQGDDTLEGNEESLTTYNDNLTINQLRHAVRSAGKMSEQRVPFSVREEAKDGLKDWWSDRLDTWFFNQLCGYTAQADTRYTGNQAAVAPSATRLVVGNDQTAEASLSATTSCQFTLKVLDRAVALAKTATPLIRPVKTDGGDHFVAFIHPFQTFQLRTNTAAGQWQDIQKAAITGGQISKNPIFNGALGVYNNVILHESTRIPAINTLGGSGTTFVNTGRRAVLCGAQAAVFGTGQDSSPNKMSWYEEKFDYGNQLGVEAGMIAGLKKAVFNSVDFATVVMSTFSPDPNA